MKNKYGNKRGKKLIFVDDSIAYLDYPRKCTENLSKNLQSSGQLKNNLKKKALQYIISNQFKNINKSQRGPVMHSPSQKTYQIKEKMST